MIFEVHAVSESSSPETGDAGGFGLKPAEPQLVVPTVVVKARDVKGLVVVVVELVVVVVVVVVGRVVVELVVVDVVVVGAAVDELVVEVVEVVVDVVVVVMGAEVVDVVVGAVVEVVVDVVVGCVVEVVVVGAAVVVVVDGGIVVEVVVGAVVVVVVDAPQGFGEQEPGPMSFPEHWPAGTVVHSSKAPPADDRTQQRVSGWVVVVVETTMVVVVVEPGQPLGPQASQQLDTCPTHALPPPGGRHERVFLRMLQWLRPCMSVRQQVMNPLRPQVDCWAQPVTESRHSFRNVPFFTARFAIFVAQLTYFPWLRAVSQWHCSSTVARAAATCSSSPSTLPQKAPFALSPPSSPPPWSPPPFPPP